MKRTHEVLKYRWKTLIAGRSFWTVVVLFVVIALLHFLTPQIRSLWPPIGVFLNRHAVERVIFLLPIVTAAFAFGRTGGNIVLVLAVLVMLPRVILISPYPWDASLETASVAVVGYLITWMIATLERERMLRQKMVTRLRAIHAVTNIATQSLELDHILKDSLDKVLEVMGLQAGMLFLLDEQAQKLVLTSYQGIPKESVAALHRFSLGEGFYGQAAQSGETMTVQGPPQDSFLTQLSEEQDRQLTELIVPLKSKGRVQGVLVVATEHPARYVSEETELLSAIGNQIGVAIENAQLHRDVERQLRIELQLNEVAEQITSELELERILPKVIQIAEELIGADGGFIALIDREENETHYPYLHNLPRELAGVRVPTGAGVAGEVATSGHPAVVEDYRAYEHAVPEFIEAGVTSVAAVPILSGGQLFGALAVISIHETKEFSNRDVAVLAGIGRQAGIAIENARLYESMRFYARQITRAQEDERKRMARELHDDTAQMLVAISRRLDALTKSTETLPASIGQPLQQLRALLSETLRGVRRFSQDLRPSVLDDLGLLPALEGLTENLTGRGIAATLTVSGARHRLSSEVELALFRIVQEALRNVEKHAEASRVAVSVEFADNRVRITVEDDGWGFEAPESAVDQVSAGKLGLVGMVERAQLVGGTLTLQSELGRGTAVTVDVPHR